MAPLTMASMVLMCSLASAASGNSGDGNTRNSRDLNTGAIIGIIWSALMILWFLPGWWAKCCSGRTSWRDVSLAHLADVIGRPKLMDMEVPASECSVRPLSMELVGGMTSLYNEGFGTKWACYIFPSTLMAWQMRLWFKLRPERMPMVEVAVGRDGTPLGYVQLAIYPMSDCNHLHVTKPGEAYVEQICVAQMARGRGIGKLLLQKAEERARAASCTFMSLAVLNGNPAISLYERFGFEVVPESKCKQACDACVILAIMGRPYGCRNLHFGAVTMEKQLT